MSSKNPKSERQMFNAKAQKVAKVGTVAAMADQAARHFAAAATRDKVTRADVEAMIDEAISHPFSTWFRHWRRRVEAKKAKMEAAKRTHESDAREVAEAKDANGVNPFVGPLPSEMR